MEKSPDLIRFERDVPRLSAQERQAIRELLQRAEAITNKRDRDAMTVRISLLANACARTNTRRDSDRRTDFDRRTLVGARVKRDQAERYREAAQASGRSLYRFVADALEAEANRVNGTQDIGWQPMITTICATKEKPV